MSKSYFWQKEKLVAEKGKFVHSMGG